jgi:ribosomal protein L37E
MALIVCPECKRQVSDKAKACPNCGYPIEEELRKAKARKTDPEGKEAEERFPNRGSGMMGFGGRDYGDGTGGGFGG